MLLSKCHKYILSTEEDAVAYFACFPESASALSQSFLTFNLKTWRGPQISFYLETARLWLLIIKGRLLSLQEVTDLSRWCECKKTPEWSHIAKCYQSLLNKSFYSPPLNPPPSPLFYNAFTGHFVFICITFALAAPLCYCSLSAWFTVRVSLLLITDVKSLSSIVSLL